MNFTFDGMDLAGRPGDTIAAALLRADVRVVNRSFKYHRPRGIWGAWVEEPNAIVDVTLSGIRTPNCRATTTLLLPGMKVASVNSALTAQRDPLAILDRFARFIPAAFYYKTFLWPSWHLFEPTIRKMAGLGHMDGTQDFIAAAPQRHDMAELLVVGAGPAGLEAALSAARAGQDVVLVDDRDTPGGSLIDRAEGVEGQAPAEWAFAMISAFRAAGGRYLPATTAFGAYDHGLFLLAERRGFPGAPALVRLRADRAILATGAIERPLTFADNDRPGIMSLHAGQAYLNRHGVLVGQRIAILTTGDAQTAAAQFRAAGAIVEVINAGEGRAEVEAVHWPGKLRGLSLSDGRQIDCDIILASAGWTPAVHLHCQTGGKLDWRDDIQGFVPRADRPQIITIGAAAGTYPTEDARSDAFTAARGERPALRTQAPVRKAWPRLGQPRRAWVDFQNDVTVKDVELAGRENMRAVQHLKRYTTLGMANDQGKLSNMPGLATIAAIRQVPIPQIGTTTFRPPFDPVSLATLAGPKREALFGPPKRLVLEPLHRAAGARMREYGGWLRPAVYTDIEAEVRAARDHVTLFDGSPLGKIDVYGPDAARFMDFIYYNTMSNLKTGRARYGFLLTEGGIVFDDGILFRLGEDHFSVSCSSAHVDQVANLLDLWRQDQFDPDRVFIQDATPHWATLTLAGPEARALMARLGFGIPLNDTDMPHLSVVQKDGMRIARVSFTGDCSYEISVPGRNAVALWQRIVTEGRDFGLTLQGVEALAILRMEKGLIFVGKDTDGTSMPHDLGFRAPREKKQAEFVGKRSLFTETANSADRLQLVGLACPGTPLPVGGHVTTKGQTVSEGYVTSSAHSPTLNQPIALALIAGGLSRMGEEVDVYHLGKLRRAAICPSCFVDPEWERLNA
jgi:sarcosine oxidase subunit alpha